MLLMPDIVISHVLEIWKTEIKMYDINTFDAHEISFQIRRQVFGTWIGNCNQL